MTTWPGTGGGSPARSAQRYTHGFQGDADPLGLWPQVSRADNALSGYGSQMHIFVVADGTCAHVYGAVVVAALALQ